MDDPANRPDERWERKDAWLGLLMGGTGLLVVFFVVLTFVRGSFVASPLVYVLGGFLGLALLAVGLNAIVRGLRSP